MNRIEQIRFAASVDAYETLNPLLKMEFFMFIVFEIKKAEFEKPHGEKIEG